MMSPRGTPTESSTPRGRRSCAQLAQKRGEELPIDGTPGVEVEILRENIDAVPLPHRLSHRRVETKLVGERRRSGLRAQAEKDAIPVVPTQVFLDAVAEMLAHLGIAEAEDAPLPRLPGAIDDGELRMRPAEGRLPGDMLAVHGVVEAALALPPRWQRTSLVENRDVELGPHAALVGQARHDREIIPIDLTDARLVGARVAGRGVVARVVAPGAHLAPVQRYGAELLPPAIHAPRQGIDRRQPPVALAEDEVIRPGDAGDVAARRAFTRVWPLLLALARMGKPRSLTDSAQPPDLGSSASAAPDRSRCAPRWPAG